MQTTSQFQKVEKDFAAEIPRTPKTGQPRIHWTDYEAVHRCLTASTAVQGKLDGPQRAIARRDGRVSLFSEKVCRVTEEMHKRGLKARPSKKCQIMAVAVEVLEIGQGYRVSPRESAVNVVSFRLTKRDADALGDFLRRTPILGVKSVNQFARKIMMDFRDGKLAYRDPADMDVDWWGLKLERPKRPAASPAPHLTPLKFAGPQSSDGASIGQLVLPLFEVQHGSPVAANRGSTAATKLLCPWITADDLTGDIERMIGILASRYVDESNPLLHLDELKAECRAKLANILDAGHLNKCPTKAKAFAFIKASMKNHVSSLVQKLVFTEKRTGIKPPPRGQRDHHSNGNRHSNAGVVLRLDDQEVLLQVGNHDPAFRNMEFLEEWDNLLTPDERETLGRFIGFRWVDSQEDADPWTDKHLREVIRSIRSKARSVLT